jgi:tRNA A-37 threonylcarbamoyl transferase component Bud32
MHKQIDSLLTAPHELSLPTELLIDKKVYQCVRILRFLSGQRVVIEAYSSEQKVIIKLFMGNSKGKRHWNRELKGYDAAKKAELIIPEMLQSIALKEGAFVVIYEFIENSSVLTEELTKPQLLLDYVANIHNSGIYQDDFHFNNILIANDIFYLIDLASVCQEKTSPLSKKQSLINLAMLIAQYSPVGQQQLLEAMEVYYEARGWAFSNAELVKFTKLLSTQWCRRRDKRLEKCFRSSTRVVYNRKWGSEYAFERPFIKDVGIELINDLENLIKQGQVLKAGNSSTVVGINYAGRSLVVKRYNIKSVGHFLRRCLRRSRAAHSWEQASLLQLLRISHMHCYGFVEKRWGPLHSTAYLIMDWAPTAKTLDTVVFNEPQELPSIKKQLQDIFKTFYDFKLVHGDCKATNFLYEENKTLSLIDLDVMRQVKSTSSFLPLHQKDKGRFLKNWTGTSVEPFFKTLFR